MPVGPGLSIFTGTNIQDQTGQLFAFGSWILLFKENPNAPGPYTNVATGAIPTFQRIFSGTMDGNGTFSAGNQVVQNTSVAPAGSKWTLIVVPNANDSSYQVDLVVNSNGFEAASFINAAIGTISVTATPLAHAYKDNEVIPTPSGGSVYFDVVNKVLKVWDSTTSSWISNRVAQVFTPVLHQFLTGMDNTGTFSAAQPAFTDISGVIDPTQLPNPSAITLGGVKSLIAVAHNFLTSIGTNGTPTQAQPSSADLSDVTSLVTLTGAQSLSNKTFSDKITTYNNVANVGNGLSATNGQADVLNQSANINTTNVITGGASSGGHYLINWSSGISIADASGASFTLSITYTSEGIVRTFTTSAITFASTANITFGALPVNVDNSTNITYSTTVTGAPTTGRYALHIWAVKQ